jgi:acetyltransferase-like isoleucine patch superfamily enzyme
MELSYVIPKVIRKIFNRAAMKDSTMDSTARADVGSVVVDSSMGRYSYIGEHTYLLAADVGSFTSISNYCAIGGGGHPMEWVSMSPVFNSSKGILKRKFSNNAYHPYARTTIGNDVWIGSHCLVKSGITISDGAVIGMGSVVTKDVGPYEIWAGNPARIIRKRFSEEQITQLCNCKWWTWEESKIYEKAKYMNQVEAFLEEING